ncbi:MAG: hypothetical protein GY738_23940 [Pseudoalteromonas sp.]|nr:hypothetical protein [Pseudoalteromonas sp.]
MPLLDSTEVDRLITPQILTSQLDRIEARLNEFAAGRHIEPRGSGGILTQEHPTEAHWWTPSASGAVIKPGANGWEGAYRFRPRLDAFKSPCDLSLEQMHDFFTKSCDPRYIQP